VGAGLGGIVSSRDRGAIAGLLAVGSRRLDASASPDADHPGTALGRDR
jgi:hypothetical protein